MLNKDNQLLLVDIGASGGIEKRWGEITSFFKCILFEPDPREFNLLKEINNENLIVLNSALSDSSKEIQFNLCKKQMVSSVLLPNYDFLNKFPDVERFQVQKKISLKADTLNNQLKKVNINEVDFIKIDTQGYELPILEGSVEYLDSAIGLQIEVEFVELYKDQPLFDKVDSFMKSKNFTIIDLQRHYWKRNGVGNIAKSKGQLIWGDALYFKSPEQILKIENVNQEKIIRSIYIYMAYGYIDLSYILLQEAKNIDLISIEVFNSLSQMIKNYEKNKIVSTSKWCKKISSFFYNLSIKINNDPHVTFGSDLKIGN